MFSENAALQRGDKVFEQWPSWDESNARLSGDVLRKRREMSHYHRRPTQRRSILSVGAARSASNDQTHHVAKKMGFAALNVTCTETKEIATLKMLKSHGKFDEYEPTLTEFFGRTNVHVEAVHTDDAPNKKKKIEAMAGAPLRGDKAHHQRRSTTMLNHYGAVHSRACHETKLSFSRARDTIVELVDSLLLAGKIKVQLGKKVSKGLGGEGDKFSLVEIEAAKEVTFDEATGEKSGGWYWDKFASHKNGKMCIPMDTREPSIIVERMGRVLE